MNPPIQATGLRRLSAAVLCGVMASSFAAPPAAEADDFEALQVKVKFSAARAVAVFRDQRPHRDRGSGDYRRSARAVPNLQRKDPHAAAVAFRLFALR